MREKNCSQNYVCCKYVRWSTRKVSMQKWPNLLRFKLERCQGVGRDVDKMGAMDDIENQRHRCNPLGLCLPHKDRMSDKEAIKNDEMVTTIDTIIMKNQNQLKNHKKLSIRSSYPPIRGGLRHLTQKNDKSTYNVINKDIKKIKID